MLHKYGIHALPKTLLLLNLCSDGQLVGQLACSQWNPDLKSWTKSSADCMSSLKWPTLETRCIYLCVAILYDILHKRYSSLCFDSYYKFKSSCTRQHSLCFVPLQATINAYRYSFFVNTPFIWNSVLHSILQLQHHNSKIVKMLVATCRFI